MAAPSKIRRLIEAVESRRKSYSFRFVQSRLSGHKFPSALGWEPLKDKYEAASKEERQHYESVWSDLYRDSVLYGRRAVSIYTASEAVLMDIAKNSKGLVDADSAYKKTYPFPIDLDDLKRQSHNGQCVSRKECSDGSIRLIACAKRSYAEREELDIQSFDAAAKRSLLQFDEVIGVRHGVVQAFDVIVIRPSEGRLELHIDLPCRMGEEDIQAARHFYTEMIKTVLTVPVERGVFESPENFFPLVKKFYAEDAGFINGLGHATGTASFKEEKMRNRRQDLRKELFHKSGIDAIKVTDPYAVSIGWATSVGSHTPTISIPGKPHLAGNPSAFVGHAILEQCAHQSDYYMLMSKLV